MRRIPAVIMSAILVTACLLLIGMQAGSPLLYSPRSDAGGADHTNPAALDRVTRDRAAQVLPLVSDLLDSPGSLVLNIKGRDFEYAARDLQEYRQLSRNLDSLVINLDMTEGELNEFRRANQQNLAILTELFNGTGRWDELQTLEIRYRDSGDSQMLTSIIYEGESLRRRIQDLYRDYLEQDRIMIETGEKFDLDTTAYTRSITDFREIVSQIDQEQDARMVTSLPSATPGERQYTLTIGIKDARVSYMDSVVIDGLLWVHEKAKREEVDLFIDSARVGTIPTNPDGSFSYSRLIEHDRGGTHTVFAVYSGYVFSEIRTFFVETQETMLDLETPVLERGRVAFQGHLLAGPTPVADAPIEILAGGKRAGTTTTGKDGGFYTLVKLSPGNHNVKAFFPGDTFPLAPAESMTFEVLVPETPHAIEGEDSLLFTPLHAVVLAVSLCVSCLVAFFYLRRKRPAFPPPVPVFHLPGEGVDGSQRGTEVPNTADEGTVAVSPALVSARESGEAHPNRELSSLFTALRKSVSRHLAFMYPLSLTPRELCLMCQKLPFREEVCRFTRGYEQARYSGVAVSEDEQDAIVHSATTAIKGLEGINY